MESENEKRKKNEEIEKRGKGQNKEAEREGMKSEEITKLELKRSKCYLSKEKA